MGNLTAQQVKNAELEPNGKGKIPTQKKISDGGGLILLINKTGKYWRYQYRFLKKQKTLALGVYPEISLKVARERHQEARNLLNKGIDPNRHRQITKAISIEAAENSFGALASEWAAKQNWTQGHGRTVQSRLDRDVLPFLRDKSVKEITAKEILDICRRVEARGAIESAHRIKTIISQVMRYCVALDLIDSDPARDLKGALTSVKPKNMAAIKNRDDIGPLMRSIDDYKGTAITRAALKLAALTFVRPGELRHAEWSEIDFDRKLWIIPPEKMKGRIKHIVPLCKQAMEIINDLYLKSGAGRYLFPSPRTTTRPMSENAVLSALRRMGYTKEEMTGHGFRSMASTNLYELGWKSELVEMQLAHKDPNEVRAAYNHAKYLDERIDMMQAWADYLDNCREDGKVIPLKRMAANE
jgi:integrase